MNQTAEYWQMRHEAMKEALTETMTELRLAREENEVLIRETRTLRMELLKAMQREHMLKTEQEGGA